jgi:hypothetical protein
MIEC